MRSAPEVNDGGLGGGGGRACPDSIRKQQPFRGFAIVQTLEQISTDCSEFLTIPDFANRVSCTELNDFVLVAGKKSTGIKRALQGGVGGRNSTSFPPRPCSKRRSPRNRELMKRRI
jgi:hypothetical protein